MINILPKKIPQTLAKNSIILICNNPLNLNNLNYNNKHKEIHKDRDKHNNDY